MNWTELTLNKSTQLHDVFIGHVYRPTSYWLAAAKLGRLVIG